MFGLAVLVALGGYVYLAKVAVQFVRKRADSKFATYATIVIFVLIPTWDIVPGWLYFNHLCEKEGGIKVFKTIEVDKSYFQSNGHPDEKKLSISNRFMIARKDDRVYSAVFHVAKFETVLHDKQTNEVLAVDVHLAHYGGWLNAYLFPQGPPTKCAGYSPYRDVWTEVIKLEPAISEGRK